MGQGWHALAVALLVAGCSSSGSFSPITWWHDLEGGRIAEARPAPPNVDAPYPSLSSVPARPQAIDAATRGRIAGGLVADRANAQYGASQAPLGVPAASLPSAARQVTPPAAAGTMSASLPAASATDAPVTPPRRAPVARVEAQPLPAPVGDAPMPAIPAGPPPPPSIAGVPMLVAPTPPLATPPPAPVVAVPVPGGPLAIAFPAGSAALAPGVQASLKALAIMRAGRPVAVTGFGEATGAEAAAQVAAMPLAWLRAQAIAGALQSAGVPAGSLRIAAEAAGRGGVAQISN